MAKQSGQQIEILPATPAQPQTMAELVKSNVQFNGNFSMESILIGNYRRGVAISLKKLQAATKEKQKELIEVNAKIEELLQTEGEKRSQTFEKNQATAFKAFDVNPNDIDFAVSADVVTPKGFDDDDDENDYRTTYQRRRKRKRSTRDPNAPIPYVYYKATVCVSTETRVIDSYSGSFTISKRFKLPVRVITLLQKRDVLDREIKKLEQEMVGIRQRESEQIAIISDVTQGVMSEQFLAQMEDGSDQYRAVWDRLATDPRITEANDEEVLKIMQDMEPTDVPRLTN